MTDTHRQSKPKTNWLREIAAGIVLLVVALLVVLFVIKTRGENDLAKRETAAVEAYLNAGRQVRSDVQGHAPAETVRQHLADAEHLRQSQDLKEMEHRYERQDMQTEIIILVHDALRAYDDSLNAGPSPAPTKSGGIPNIPVPGEITRDMPAELRHSGDEILQRAEKKWDAGQAGDWKK